MSDAHPNLLRDELQAALGAGYSLGRELAFASLAVPLGWLGVALNGWAWSGTLTILPAAVW